MVNEMTEEPTDAKSNPQSLAGAPRLIAVASNNVVAHPRLYRSGAVIRPMIPSTMDEIQKQATIIAKSGVVPKAFMSGTVVNLPLVGMVIMKGLEVGFAPLTAIEWIMEINGRLSVWGDGAIAILQGKQLLEKQEAFWVWDTIGADGKAKQENRAPFKPFPFKGLPPEKWPTDLSCLVRLKRIDGQWWEGEFSIEQAKTAHLWRNASKKPWMEYPDRMLFNRARAYAVRDGFSDGLNGLLIREEIEDVEALEAPAADTSSLVDEVSPIIENQTLTVEARNDAPVENPVDETPVVDSASGAAADNPHGPDPAAAAAPVDNHADAGGPVGDQQAERALEAESQIKEFRRRLLKTETSAAVDDLIDSYKMSLEDFRLQDATRYTKLIEEVSGRRTALGKRRK